MSKSKIFFLFFLLAGIVYFNSFWVKFIWDDEALIVKNYLIRDFSHIFGIFTSPVSFLQNPCFWRPLQILSYCFDFFLYKFNYRGYHLTNILLHTIVGILFFHLSLYFIPDKKICVFSCLLFLLSPLWVEVVTYISGRADILVAIFLLLSFLLFLKERFFLSWVFYLFSLFSKESAFVYPLLVVFYLWLFKKFNKKSTFYLFSLFFLSFLIFSIHQLIAPVSLTSSFSLSSSFLFFIKAISKYLRLLFFPFHQHMSYTVKIPYSFFEKEVIFSFFLLTGLIYLFIYFYKKNKNFAFFLGWFFIFLLPYSGIIPINAFFAEHFLYISSWGIFILFVCFLKIMIKNKKIFLLFLLSYLAFFASSTIKYNFIWQKEMDFYKRIIKFSPGSFSAYNNLGVIYFREGNIDKAQPLFKKALKINPEFKEAYLNLAYCYYLKGDIKETEKIVKDILKKDSHFPYAWSLLGKIYLDKKEYKKAESFYQKAVKINPQDISLWQDLFLFYKTLNRKEAERIKKRIEEMDEFALAQIYFHQARALWEKNQLGEALEEIRKAIKINSFNSEYYNLYACIFKRMKKYELAYLFYKKALRIDPFNERVYNNLGNLWVILGRFKEAEKNFKKAISLNEEYPEAYFNLGLLYLEKKKINLAKKMFRKTLYLAPQFKPACFYLKKIDTLN
ncbi:MAG: hypothetical protein B6D56_02690 [Candidatus Omnitrophica bacterium 4484_70.1]|nr:MAG: hypothetical protein B6D56_02690 [Candidatus Omnitrophica bacterium 4484_70.1]